MRSSGTPINYDIKPGMSVCDKQRLQLEPTQSSSPVWDIVLAINQPNMQPPSFAAPRPTEAKRFPEGQ